VSAYGVVDSKPKALSGGNGPELKVDLHVHTGDDPEDRVGYTSYELLDLASDQGFDVISIANHDRITYSEELRNYAEKLDILLIPGVEKTIYKKHVLVINAGSEDLDVESFGELSDGKRSSKLIIAPHPFYPSPFSLKDDLTSQVGLFDAIEYSHYYTVSMNFNKRAVELSNSSKKPLVGTSDAHFPYQLGTTYTMVNASKDIHSVVNAVKKGRIRVVSDPLSLSQALRIRLSMSLI
jgi:predicted metal-dependent phosphoesterase TrpH